MTARGLVRLAVGLVISILAKFTVEGTHITTNPLEVSNKTFSYIVVGGGTAGLAVASRLAEDPRVTILVIEAGPDAQNDTLVNDPENALLVTPVYNWRYNTTVQAVGGKSLGMDQGKVLGGSSSINGMCWTRATIDQYDSLEGLGNPGWNFMSMLRYMKKAELFHLPNSDQISRGATVLPFVHGLKGNLEAGFAQPYEAATLAGDIVSAARSAIRGLAENLDVNSGVPNGAARFQFSISPGNNTIVTPGANKRSSAANAYIYSSVQEKQNLFVLTGYQAIRITWGKHVRGLSTASGVKFVATPTPNTDSGPEFFAESEHEVIIACGAIGSPHFLELSGIGDSRILAPLGIPIEVDLPSVGTNLQEQASNSVAYSVQPHIPSSYYSTFNAPYATAVVYLDLEQVLGTASAKIVANDLLKSIPRRVEEIVSAGAFTSETGLKKILSLQAKSIVEFKAPVLEFASVTTTQLLPGVPIIGTPYWNLIPQWRGTVHVKSANPSVEPRLNPRFFLGSDFDLYIKGNATRLARKIFDTMPLKKYTLEELLPGLEMVPVNATDSQVQDFVKNTYTSVFHPVGSVSMLPREAGGAVGPDLIVYGTKNVRVVDASIIPIQLSAHLSSTVYGIAEKAADMIKNACIMT